MKINRTLLLIVVLVASVVLCPVMADSEDAGGGMKNPLLSKNSENGKVNDTVDPVKKVKDNGKGTNDLSKSKGGENEAKNPKEGAEDEQKETNLLHSDSGKKSNEERLPSVREKCDSLSNSCMDDDKNFVACLRVPGNESPELSLLIQNKGKGPLTVTISAPDLVELAKKQIKLQEKEDTEVKVSIKGVESGHLIVLTAGHGNCSLDFRDQFTGKSKAAQTSDSTHLTISNQTSPSQFVVFAALFIAIVLIITGISFWKKYFPRKGHKYQKLDGELPVSHGGKQEQSANEGWDDDGWGETWDDEEAPNTPSMPLTPSLSSRGISSRKFSSKDGWKD